MNLFRKKVDNEHMEVVDGSCTKTEDNNIFMCRWSLQDYYWKKDTYEILDIVHPHYNVEQKMRQYMYNIYVSLYNRPVGSPIARIIMWRCSNPVA